MVLAIMMAVIVSFLITAAACPLFIKRMLLMQYGQQIRTDGPNHHSVKAGTPTMGGIIFILTAALVSLVLVGPAPQLFAVLLVTLGCGLIGFLDDYLKISRSRSLGLKARSKLAGEAALTLIFIILTRYMGLYSSAITLPVINLPIDLGFVYPIFVFLIISGFSNSVNLTDGVDGLAAGAAIITLTAFIYISYRAGVNEIALFCGALAGGCLGFLIYNRHPARLFMGDVGSLALGGSFAAVAVLMKVELFLLIIGGIFVLEALSVIAQVISYQLTSRRILLMSPLHHHFELKGWSEWQVVSVFWILSFIFSMLGALAYGYGA